MRNQQCNWTGESHAFDVIAQHPGSFKQYATVNVINAAREDVIGPYQTRKGAYNQEDLRSFDLDCFLSFHWPWFEIKTYIYQLHFKNRRTASKAIQEL